MGLSGKNARGKISFKLNKVKPISRKRKRVSVYNYNNNKSLNYPPKPKTILIEKKPVEEEVVPEHFGFLIIRVR